MAITRREFITRAGLLTAGGLLGPAFRRNPFLQKALADAMGDRYLVILQADGGNDGLNTVIPTSDAAGAFRTRYEIARTAGLGGLQVPTGALGATTIDDDPISGTSLALHPGLAGFKHLYDAGKLAVIQGCGYPNPSLSHPTSTGLWQRGDPLNVFAGAAGWMGRYLIAARYGGADISSVTVGKRVAGELVQNTTSVLAFNSLSNFTFPYDNYLNFGDRPSKRTAYRALYSAASGVGVETRKFVGNVGTATLTASESYPQIDAVYVNDRPSWNAGYRGSNIATDLLEVAKVIYAVENNLQPDVRARFFQVRQPGYDTHSDQGGTSGRHSGLHTQVGSAIEQFYNDLDNMPASGGGKVSDKVCILWWSEFGRRIVQNSSGTDHGSQGPIFVIGGQVNGGVYGNHPDINVLDSQGNTIYSQATGDPHRSTDFRDVFGTILKHWLNLADPSSVFPADAGSPNAYWTSPNFDLGFLS